MRIHGLAVMVLLSCSDDGAANESFGTESASASASGDSGSTSTSTATSSAGSSTGADSTASVDDTAGVKLDVAPDDLGDTDTGPIDRCTVSDDGDAPGPCRTEAPPDSFDPVVQWDWSDPVETQSLAVPLVANLTDDDKNGEIDLCDTPDVIVQTFASWSADAPAHLHVLDGETGVEHFAIDSVALVPATNPALGDIDGDGLVEIVALQQSPRNLVAFEHDGAMKWGSSAPWASAAVEAYFYGSIALADLDADGDVEILAGNQVFDHSGAPVVTLGDQAGQVVYGNATVAADLDGDDDLEVVLGRSAFHHDGTEYYMQAGIDSGYPQIANLDADPQPEVLVENPNGISVLEHDGAIKLQDQRPTGVGPGLSNWFRPSTVHDFDGDGASEFAVSSSDLFTEYEADVMVIFSVPVSDGQAGGGGTTSTAFDFLGDGAAEAMYADEYELHAYDAMGTEIFSIPRSSSTIIEYPIVADVDNDDSAELVIVSSEGFGGEPTPTVQVIRDAKDRWIPARRIWNQHTYHVTNVREDGTIPQVEPKSWSLLNTYRTQAQIEAGGVCMPEPAG